MTIKGLGKTIMEALFPPRGACFSCGREAVLLEDGLCEDCHSGIETFNSAPTLDSVDGYSAAFVYNDVSGRMVKKLKYGGKKYVAKQLASFVSIPDSWHIDAVVPVPLHRKRVWKRGFNQSELIAKHICSANGLDLEPSLLKRVRDTAQQTRMTEAGRKRNVRNAFSADERVKGLDILLVDDVRTTGATLSECASTLKKKGCGKVFAVTVCFAKPEDR